MKNIFTTMMLFLFIFSFVMFGFYIDLGSFSALTMDSFVTSTIIGIIATVFLYIFFE